MPVANKMDVDRLIQYMAGAHFTKVHRFAGPPCDSRRESL